MSSHERTPSPDRDEVEPVPSPSPRQTPSPTPGYAQGMLQAPRADGHTLTRDPVTGRTGWTLPSPSPTPSPTPEQIHTSPTNPRSDGRFFARDPGTGKTGWRLTLSRSPSGSPPPRSAGWVSTANPYSGLQMRWHTSKGPQGVLPIGETPDEHAATPTPSPPTSPREPLLSARVRPRQESITCGVINTTVVQGAPSSPASETSSSSLQIEGYSPTDYPPSPPAWSPESPPAPHIRKFSRSRV